MPGPDDRVSWITDYMLVGAQPEESEIPIFLQAGIGAVLNLRHEDTFRATYERVGLPYAHVPIRDFSTPSPRQFADCHVFIDAQREDNRAVLIHCALGIGRSATVALSYLLVQGISLGDALEHLRQRRPAVDPSARQLAAAAMFARDAIAASKVAE